MARFDRDGWRTIKRWELSGLTISPSTRPSGETRTETGGVTTKPTAPPRSTISPCTLPIQGHGRDGYERQSYRIRGRCLHAIHARGSGLRLISRYDRLGCRDVDKDGFSTPPTCGRPTRLGLPTLSLTILPSGTTRTTTATAITSSISTDKRGGPPTAPTAAVPRRANRRSTVGVAPTGTGMVGPTQPPFGWPVRAARGMHGLRTPPSGTTPTVMAVAITHEETRPTFVLL